MIHPARMAALNNRTIKNRDFVVYWMQASQRVSFNHALAYAIARANELNKPLLVVFGLTDDYPHANRRHYTFMLEGLRETQKSLEEIGIRMIVLHRSPPSAAAEFAGRACLVVADCGYTRLQRSWRAETAGRIDVPLILVESDVVVPIALTSTKEEYAARTIRPKINRLLADFLIPLQIENVRRDSLGISLHGENINDDGYLDRLKIDRSVLPVANYRGGYSHAVQMLDDFLMNKLDRYETERNDPNLAGVSGMSPYLHFGQISPLEIALRAKELDSPGESAFLEELIVRRELSMNFVLNNSAYDRYECLPEWCRKTLERHITDFREYQYTVAEFENAMTHDPYWNAAQKEMVLTGKMHGYMRMYWGKKILEWSATPHEAYRIALFLNDKYELDGRDPNGYTGVAWCFGKHDRPWTERPVFGAIRYMNDKGLRRKFDADAYAKKIDTLKPNEPAV